MLASVHYSSWYSYSFLNNKKKTLALKELVANILILNICWVGIVLLLKFKF